MEKTRFERIALRLARGLLNTLLSLGLLPRRVAESFSVFILILLSVLYPGCLFAAGSFSLSYKSGMGTRAGTTAVNGVLKTDALRYAFKLSLSKDGKVDFSSPPMFNMRFANGLYLGEMKLQGFARFALNPMAEKVFTLYRQKFLNEGGTPVLKPSFSGIGANFVLKKREAVLAAALFNPLFGKTSPLGAMAGFSTQHGSLDFFGAFLFLDSNGTSRVDSTAYQNQWRSLSIYNKRRYVLLGLSSDSRAGPFRIRTFVFTDIVHDCAFGAWGVIGWNTSVAAGSYKADVYNRYNSSGLLSEPVEKRGFTLGIEKDLLLEASFGLESYPEPIYGNTSQEREFWYSLELNREWLIFAAKHTYHLEKTTGHEALSSYSLELGKFRTEGNEATFKASLTLDRTPGAAKGVRKYSIRLQDRNARLEFSGGKVLLTLAADAMVSGMKLGASITQDRVLTLTGKWAWK